MRTSRCGVFVALTFTLVCSLGVVTAPFAGAASKGGSIEHCTLEIIGINEDGSYETGPLECVSGAPSLTRSSGFVTMSSIIAVHYEGYGFTGSSLGIQGGGCDGGWLNLPVGWRNRIASTSSACTVRHYAGTGLSGAFNSTFNPGGNLGTVAFDAESAKYL